MDEYIKRDKSLLIYLGEEAYKQVQRVPAADVRPVVRGKWLKYAPDNSDMLTCSECEHYWILDGDQYDYRYCPYCGADMREVDHD